MAFHGIQQCYSKPDKWFSGIVTTDGRGAPATMGEYKDFTPDEMVHVRADEQKKAAHMGDHGFLALLNWTSKEMRDPALSTPTDELVALIEAARPEIIYTHNLCDKHPTHVGVAVRVVNACRQLAPEAQPKAVWGCEVWRDLDWMVDSDKILLDCTGRDNMQAALLGVFDSQVSGGKRYDLATLGRRRAHATYWESHEGDSAELLNFAMDLTPLVADPDLCFKSHVKGYMDRFYEDVAKLIGNVTG